MRRLVAALATTLTLAATAAAADVPARLEAGPWEAAGDAHALTRKAMICIPQTVRPGVTSAPTILSSDVDAGIVVANNAFEYADRFMGMNSTEQARSVLTFEAKDGRFRVVFSDIEQYDTPFNRWRAAARPTIVPRLNEIGEQLAACIKAGGQTNDW